MRGTIELTTERLRLRRFTADDAHEVYLYFGADDQMHAYTGWNPYVTEEKAADEIRRTIEQYDDPDERTYSWAVELDGALIGLAAAYDYDPDTDTIEIGISIRRTHWGKGYAGEVLTCILHYLSEEEKIGTLTAWCAADNIGSMRALTRAGMTQVATEPGALTVGDRCYDKLIFEYR